MSSKTRYLAIKKALLNSLKSNNFLFVVFTLILSFEYLYFWRECTLYAEGSKVLFNLIESETFSVTNFRMLMMGTQLPSLIAIKIGNFSYLQIILLQSISYLFFHLTILAIILFYLKDTRSSMLYLLIHFIGGATIHFINEWSIFMALNVAILIYSILKNKGVSQSMHYIIVCILIFFVINAHFAAGCLVLLSISVFIDKIPTKKILGMFFIIAVAIGFSLKMSSYSKDHTFALLSNSSSYKNLLSFMSNYMFSLVFVLTLILVLFFIKNHWKKKINTIQFLICLLFICLNVNHLAGNYYSSAYHYYYEGYLFSVFAAISFVLLSTLFDKRRVVLLSFFVIAFQVVNLYILNNKFHINTKQNFEVVENLSKKYPDKKLFVVTNDNELINTDWSYYQFFYESYLISRILELSPLSIYLTNDTSTYFKNSERVFVNRSKSKVDINDESTFHFIFEPNKDLGKAFKVSTDEILKL